MMKRLVLLYNGAFAASADVDETPSMSLMALSAYLKANGFDCQLLRERSSDDELRLLLQSCIAAGFSLYTGSGSIRALSVAARIRRLDPGVALVFGGVHATLEAEQTMRHSLVDYAVRGEGEKTFLELLRMLSGESQTAPDAILGLSHKNDGRIIHNAPRPASDLEEFPMVDYDLYGPGLTGKPLPYISSRGCPYHCRFCCSAALNRREGKRFMQLSIKRVAEDLKELVRKHAPSEIRFMDDTFLLNESKIREFIAAYKQNGFHFPWTALSRCNVFDKLDDSTVRSLAEINMRRLLFGVESGSQKILDYVSKQIRREQVIGTIEKLARAGLAADFTFMNGFPTETMQDVRESLRLGNDIRRISPRSTVTFFVFTPQPGAEIYDECVSKFGFPRRETLEQWADGYEYHTFRPPWLPFSHRNKINVISWASFFDDPEAIRSYALSSWQRLAFRLLGADGRIRLRSGWLSFAPEFLLVNWLVVLKTRRFIRNALRDVPRNSPAGAVIVG